MGRVVAWHRPGHAEGQKPGVRADGGGLPGEAIGTRARGGRKLLSCEPLVGETLRAKSSRLDLIPPSLARTPSIRELTQRAGAKGATIPETSLEG